MDDIARTEHCVKERRRSETGLVTLAGYSVLGEGLGSKDGVMEKESGLMKER